MQELQSPPYTSRDIPALLEAHQVQKAQERFSRDEIDLQELEAYLEKIQTEETPFQSHCYCGEDITAQVNAELADILNTSQTSSRTWYGKQRWQKMHSSLASIRMFVTCPQGCQCVLDFTS